MSSSAINSVSHCTYLKKPLAAANSFTKGWSKRFYFHKDLKRDIALHGTHLWLSKMSTSTLLESIFVTTPLYSTT